MDLTKWDKRFLEMAKLVSTWSKDPSTKCGAVITRGKHIVTVGFNGFAAGCNDDPLLYDDRNSKYPRIIHAEINSILSAKQNLSDCNIYIYPLLPCSQCAAAIIQAGIKTIIAQELTPELTTRWGESLQQSKNMFQEAGVSWRTYENF